MPTANTDEVFIHAVGKRVRGVLFDALPLSDRTLARGTKTLILDDGTGLTISSANCSYWVDSADVVARAIHRKQWELEAAQAQLADVLELAGA